MLEKKAPHHILYHIGYRFPDETTLAQQLFSNTRIVVLCGTASRAHSLARRIAAPTTSDYIPPDELCRTGRFTMLQPHGMTNVLVVSHGIGTGSVDCVLNDVHHLLRFAGARQWSLLRVGSCGGIGVSTGTIIVSRNALNGALSPTQPRFILGQQHNLPAKLDATLSEKLYTYLQSITSIPDDRARPLGRTPPAVAMGDTLSAETFFDCQARCDGLFPPYGEARARGFLRRCKEAGVVNIEMESLALAVFAARAGVPAAVVCAALVDRLVEETPTEGVDALKAYEETMVTYVAQFVRESFCAA